MTVRGVREHWYTDDQFERQLRDPAHTAVILRRWDTFATAIRQFCGGDSAPSLKVLDAGCGDGINLVGLRRILADIGRPSELFAVDINPVRIARVRAESRAPGAITFGSVTALPFASRSFDVVLCNHVIEHVPHPAEVVAEISRILRPGGLALIGVPNEGCAIARLRNHVLQRSILRATDHVNFFTRATLLRLMDHAGLNVEDVRAGGFFLPHLRLSTMAMAFAGGRWLLDALGRVWPSQAADLIAIARKA